MFKNAWTSEPVWVAKQLHRHTHERFPQTRKYTAVCNKKTAEMERHTATQRTALYIVARLPAGGAVEVGNMVEGM